MGKKVMIVDDSSTIRQQVTGALTRAGYEVVEAVDGEDALRCVAKVEGIAIVLCDVNMPRMNGIDLLMRLKGGGANASLIVVMLTTEGHPDLIARAKSLGAKGWLVKPLRSELLLATVKKLIGALGTLARARPHSAQCWSRGQKKTNGSDTRCSWARRHRP